MTDLISLFKLHPQFDRHWTFTDRGDTWEFLLEQTEDLPAFRLPFDCKLESDNYTPYTVLTEHPKAGVVFYLNGYSTKVRAYMSDSGLLSSRLVVFQAGAIICLLPKDKAKVIVTRLIRLSWRDQLSPHVLFYPKRGTKGVMEPLPEDVKPVEG
jgi:hypothetical protein